MMEKLFYAWDEAKGYLAALLVAILLLAYMLNPAEWHNHQGATECQNGDCSEPLR